MPEPGRSRRIPFVELVAGIVGLLIVIATIGYLAFETLRGGPRDPVLAVEILRVRQVEGSFAVDVEIRNRGQNAAADVHVAAATRSGQPDGLRAEVRVDYVPGQSTARATLLFAADPGSAPDVRVVGYAEP